MQDGYGPSLENVGQGVAASGAAAAAASVAATAASVAELTSLALEQGVAEQASKGRRAASDGGIKPNSGKRKNIKPNSGDTDNQSPEKKRKQALDASVRVMFKSKERYDKALATASSLNLEVLHDDRLSGYKGNIQIMERFNTAKNAMLGIVNSNFRRAFVSCQNIAATKKFGNTEGLKQSVVKFSVDLEAPLVTFEKEVKKLAEALEIEKHCSA